MELDREVLRGYLDYLRDLGVRDFYRSAEPSGDPELIAWLQTVQPQQEISPKPLQRSQPLPARPAQLGSAIVSAKASSPARGGPEIVLSAAAAGVAPTTSPDAIYFEDTPPVPAAFAPPVMPLVSFNQLAPVHPVRVAAEDKAAALRRVREIIGDCTRCPLAYAGRHNIVFADGDPNARLMFVGEGPGADEDATGVPFVGKAGQLLNNMIAAMGLKREEVYIANIVKCRPPKNRVPEPVEANTCSQFLLQQIDIVQPEVIVALGSTAATYLLGVRQSLNTLRGLWHDVRGAKCAVTYHPAFLLRDPRQKSEAWKDLQRVMVALELKPSTRG